jgi:hypothetical protein
VGERLARLLMRIDQFAARLSPRIARRAQAGAQAARAIFLDEQRQQDEAGAALIKAVGLYPPGTFVRLANGEEGMVVKRGTSATEPLVAALLGKSGNPLTEPVPRDARLPQPGRRAGSGAPRTAAAPVDREAAEVGRSMNGWRRVLACAALLLLTKGAGAVGGDWRLATLETAAVDRQQPAQPGLLRGAAAARAG